MIVEFRCERHYDIRGDKVLILHLGYCTSFATGFRWRPEWRWMTKVYPTVLEDVVSFEIR